jgi:hypothetical protein
VFWAAMVETRKQAQQGAAIVYLFTTTVPPTARPAGYNNNDSNESRLVVRYNRPFDGTNAHRRALVCT